MPLRRLSASQVERTVADVLGVSADVAVADERLFTYYSNVSTAIDATGARGYLDFAEVVAGSADLSRCSASDCLDWLIDEAGPRLFRRPLTVEQRTSYESLYRLGGPDGSRWVLEAMLQSPSFLYLDEVVADDGTLDDYSIAARMALVLWGRNPDSALLARAGERRLSSADEIRQEAIRMIADPASEGGLHDFVDQWLQLYRLDDPDTRPDLAALGDDTVAALRNEPVRLFGTLLEQGSGLRDLLTTSQSVHLDPLASIYGDDIVSMTEDTHSLDPARRAGILSLPGVMAALSHAGATSPTRRGFEVLAHFLCTPPPPPPAGVSLTSTDGGSGATARERLELHLTDDYCGACHRTMDGIGFAFEGIDWLGRSRDEQDGRPIDDLSTFVLEGEEITVKGAVELAAKLAETPAVAECVAREWAQYATGVPETEGADCLMERLGEEIVLEDGLATMMLTYLTSDWFRRKRAGGS